jgi:hypothetical protein
MADQNVPQTTRECRDCAAPVKASMTMAAQVASCGGPRGFNLCPACIAKRRVARQAGA